MNLTVVDLSVLIVYVSGVVLLGLWLGRGRQNAKQYLLGGKDAPWWAVLGSIVATETSTVTFLSIPGITFANGGNLCFLQLALGLLVGRTLIVVLFLPLYFRGELFTAYQVLQERFGGGTQRAASLIFLVARNLGDGLRLFLTALVLEQTLGWSLSNCVIFIGSVTILFTVVGGMKSVIWNDCLQLVVYVVGGVVALLLIVGRLPDGFPGLLDFARETGRLRILDFRFDVSEANTFWAGLIGGAFLTLGTHGTDQMMVQRLLAARSQADAGKALVASALAVGLQFALFLWVGIALAAFYDANPVSYVFNSGDQVFASYIVNEMPSGIGVIGLLLAAVFSAAISTLSSSLNSSATAVVNDWILFKRGDDRDATVVRVSRLLTIGFGVVQIVIGILAQRADEAVIDNAMAIASFSAGLLLGLFALGRIQGVTQWAALTALVAGFGTLLIVKFGLPIWSDGVWTIAWPWFALIGCSAMVLVGVLCRRIPSAASW